MGAHSDRKSKMKLFASQNNTDKELNVQLTDQAEENDSGEANDLFHCRESEINDLTTKSQTQCDSRFSTCCERCMRRKQLADKGIVVPLAMHGTLRADKLENIKDVTLKRIPSKSETWDLWNGRTIEFDICRRQFRDRIGVCRFSLSGLYLPYQKQRENWIFSTCSRKVSDDRICCKSHVPLYLRTSSRLSNHYENTPIQIYRKFHLQTNWKFSDKKLIFFISLLKT